MTRAFVVCMLLARATAAHADDVVAYEAEGESAASATDARAAALDDAFAHAVASALADLVAGDVRTAHKGELDKEIVGHARLWVTRFTVTKDEVDDDRRELTVSVRIDRDKLRTRLDELKITSHDASGNAPAEVAGQRSATILLRIASEKSVRASFGKDADHDLDGLGELATRLRAAGYSIRRAPDDGPAPTSAGDVPDVDVDALATAAQADVAALAGVTVGEPAFVRGQAQPAVLATAHVRLVDHTTHQTLGQGAAIAAGSPDDRRTAIARALDGALGDALPPAAKQLGPPAALTGDDHPVGESGMVLVRLSAKTPYTLVLAEQRYLAGAKGVRAATLRRMSPAGWVIGVTTSDAIDRVAQVAKKPPTGDTSSAVKIVGDVVEVALTGTAP
ncbi:MAG TPA: hypothetical protein VH143_13375 [Kofleriaceae bacterium]|jgi:hypothetical protein|nr:hypothetical protein [Kofleriaceae bacterium]